MVLNTGCLICCPVSKQSILIVTHFQHIRHKHKFICQLACHTHTHTRTKVQAHSMSEPLNCSLTSCCHNPLSPSPSDTPKTHYVYAHISLAATGNSQLATDSNVTFISAARRHVRRWRELQSAFFIIPPRGKKLSQEFRNISWSFTWCTERENISSS